MSVQSHVADHCPCERSLVAACRASAPPQCGQPVPLLGCCGATDAWHFGGSEHYVLLHTALEKLARMDPHKSRVVQIGFLGGMDVEETAEAPGVFPNAVIRD